jgi:hypothetical protein
MVVGRYVPRFILLPGIQMPASRGWPAHIADVLSGMNRSGAIPPIHGGHERDLKCRAVPCGTPEIESITARPVLAMLVV